VKEALRMASQRASQRSRGASMASNNEDTGPTLTNLAKQYQTNNQESIDIENVEELFSQVPKKDT
jgi:hypothetical protein